MATLLPPKGAQYPQFSANAYCGQTAGWIKMPLSMEAGLGAGHIVLYMGTQLRPYGKEHSSPNVYACCAGLVSYAPLLITQLTIVCLLHGRRQACVRKPRPMCIVAKGPPSQLLLSTCKFVTNLRIG